MAVILILNPSLRPLRLCEIPLLHSSRFSRQDAKIAKKFRLVTVIPILIPSLRSLRLCEILSLQLAASLAKTPRSPRSLPLRDRDRHSYPLFALFASLRDSLPPVNPSSRQDAKIAKGFSP